MALKITTQIGTDKGITSEAYVRIADYQVSKYGSANFRLEIFQSQDDVTPAGTPFVGAASTAGMAKNQQIGDSLYVALTKQEERTRSTTRMVPVEVTVQVDGPVDPQTGEKGPATDQVITQMQEQEIEETYTVTVPDLSSLEDGTIFEFGYGHLKAKLEGLFGAENVVDC